MQNIAKEVIVELKKLLKGDVVVESDSERWQRSNA